MQAPDHRDRKIAFAIEHLGDAGARTDNRLEIASSQPLLLHAKLDRLDRIGRIHRFMFALIGVNQGRQHIEPVAVGRAGVAAPGGPSSASAAR